MVGVVRFCLSVLVVRVRGGIDIPRDDCEWRAGDLGNMANRYSTIVKIKKNISRDCQVRRRPAGSGGLWLRLQQGLPWRDLHPAGVLPGAGVLLRDLRGEGVISYPGFMT